MTAQWLPAGDALRTDWTEADPCSRTRQPKNEPAEFPCTHDLGNNKGPCKERYYSAEALRFHEDTDHYHLPSDFGMTDKRGVLDEESGTRPRPGRRMWWDK